MMRTLMIMILALLVLFAPNLIAEPLPERLDSLLRQSTLDGAQIGISVYDLTADSAIFNHEGDKLFIPASNMKLFTSAAALELLGPEFRFTTVFLLRGEIDKKGRLKGDLVIVGGGDPLISGRFRDNLTEVLDRWADSLNFKGIKEIDGKIIADNSLFEPPDLGPAWSWDDLSYWYACPISALSFNDNCVDLKFLPGNKVGDPAVIEINPHTDYITIRNLAKTVPAESSFTLDYFRIPYTNNVTFFGGIPLGDTAGEVDYVSVDRPELFLVNVFEGVLGARGVKCSGIASLTDLSSDRTFEYKPEKLKPLFKWHSDSLGIVLKVINTNSQNFFAEQTLRIIGVEKAGGGTFAEGIQAVSNFYESIGISSNDLIMRDGSGLSYLNLVKPSAIIKLLKYMTTNTNHAIYYASLARPGIDRAMRNRLLDNPRRSNIAAKTGNIANVGTLSGYLEGARTGHLYAFSIMVNNYRCGKSEVETWQDSVLALLLEEF